MNEAKAHGIALLIKEKRELEKENDKFREEINKLQFPYGDDFSKLDKLMAKIDYNDKQIQDIQDYLVPKDAKLDVNKKKKGFYLFGYKIF